MQLSFNLDLKNPNFRSDIEVIRKTLASVETIDWMGTATATQTTTTMTTEPTTTRTRKVAAPVQEEFDLGDAAETEEEETTKEPVVTKADMMAALRAYTNKTKLTDMLKTKFKVKGTAELKESQYGDVVKAIAKLK